MTYIHKNIWTWGQTHTIVQWNGVGLVNISIENDNPENATIHGISVLPTYRKKGKGTILLGLAENEARKMGCHWVNLSALKGGFEEKWYRDHGYNDFPIQENEEMVCLIKELE